ncbi:MAG: hypothetical protein RLZZ136_1355, partial [Pseudomonadota bacterium]
MRKLVMGMALASTALATPAMARDASWYVEADVGGVVVEDADYSILNVAGAGRYGAKTGYDFGGIVGYDFGTYRLEAETSYRRAGLDALTYNPRALALSGAAVDGKADALSFMVNGLLDFGPDDGLQGFIGGGAGIARVGLQNRDVRTATAVTVLDDSHTGFAWQAIAGVRTPLSSRADIGLKYRYFNATGVDVIDTA